MEVIIIKNKLIKIWNVAWCMVIDVFGLFVFLMCATWAVNTAIDKPDNGITTLVFAIVGYSLYKFKTRKVKNRE